MDILTIYIKYLINWMRYWPVDKSVDKTESYGRFM